MAVVCCHQFSLSAANKSDKLKPKWVTHSLPEPKCNSYFFLRTHGEGKSLIEAKQMAFIELTHKIESERGIKISTNVKVEEIITENEKNGDDYEYQQVIGLDITEDGQEIKIVCREIDDYWVKSSNKYQVDVLYTVTNQFACGGSYDDEIIVSSKYPEAGFFSLIPSVGQFYKGSKVKGSLILSSEILAVGGILLCENTRASYIKKMQEQPQYASQYNSRADAWQTGRNICIGAAAAIYVCNLIDAFVATGAKRVKVEKKHTSFAMVPYIDNQAMGVGLQIKF